MRYWWVNQNQTYRHEVPGGYLWSPKRKANQAQNPFYDFMREVTPGDVIFSFSNTTIRAIGVAASYAYEAPKPLEFGQAGAYWNNIGWRIDVKFHELRLTTRPADHMNVLAPLLPIFAAALIDLLGAEAHSLVKGYFLAEEQPTYTASGVGLVQWEEHELNQVQTDTTLVETEKEAIVLARRGQGLFKRRVMTLEHACRITGVDREEHLRASHCKLWRDATNEERLDGENGLLLTPSMDHLFDRGFIGFDDNGQTVISPVAHQESLARMGLDPQHPPKVGSFSSGQRKYLAFHRENVLLMSRFLEHL
jgi:putative restriction endonuclease